MVKKISILYMDEDGHNHIYSWKSSNLNRVIGIKVFEEREDIIQEFKVK